MKKDPFDELRAMGVTMSVARRNDPPVRDTKRRKATPKAVVVAVRQALRDYQGLSAATIAGVLVPELADFSDGLCGYGGLGSAPSDPDDFSRCRRIVALIPNGLARMDEVAVAFPKVRAWARLAPAWAELEAMFVAEEQAGWKAPHLMFARMQELTR